MVYRKFTLFSFQCIKDYCIVAYRVIFFFTLTKQYYNYLIDDLFYNSDEWCWYFVSASENGQTLVKMWLLILTFVYFNLPYHFFFSINFKVTGTSNVICSSSFHFSIKADRKKKYIFFVSTKVFTSEHYLTAYTYMVTNYESDGKIAKINIKEKWDFFWLGMTRR